MLIKVSSPCTRILFPVYGVKRRNFFKPAHKHLLRIRQMSMDVTKIMKNTIPDGKLVGFGSPGHGSLLPGGHRPRPGGRGAEGGGASLERKKVGRVPAPCMAHRGFMPLNLSSLTVPVARAVPIPRLDDSIRRYFHCTPPPYL